MTPYIVTLLYNICVKRSWGIKWLNSKSPDSGVLLERQSSFFIKDVNKYSNSQVNRVELQWDGKNIMKLKKI